MEVHLFGAREQLSNNEAVRVDLSCLIEHVLGQVDRCRVTVVDTEALEVFCHQTRVLCHVLPQVGAVLWAITVTKFDAVSPDDNLSTQVRARLRSSVIPHGVGSPYPSVVDKCK